jgi:hypothetical protein
MSYAKDQLRQGTETFVYQSSLTLSTTTLTFLGDLLRGHLLSPRYATTLLRALLVLTRTEVAL